MSCEFLFMNGKVILRVGNLFYHLETKLRVSFYELKVQDDKFRSWKFKMIFFKGREVVFYKLNIYDANVTPTIACLNQISR